MKTIAAYLAKINRWGGLVALVSLILLLMFLGSIELTAVVFVLAGVITIHELGHYVTARITGMKVTDFFLGFGPRLWSFKRGETTYGVRLLPLGAYVRIIGMHSAEKVDPVDEPRAYRSKSFPRRVLVITAGSMTHFMMAFVALIVLYGFVGSTERSTEIAWEVSGVPTEFADGTPTPASASGLTEGDRIFYVIGEDSQAVSTIAWPSFNDAIKSNPGENIQLLVQRDGGQNSEGITHTLNARIATDPVTGEGRIGIAATTAYDYNNTSALPVAVVESVREFGNIFWQSVYGAYKVFGDSVGLVDRIISPPNDPTANENLETRPLSVIGLAQIGASDIIDNWGDRLLLFAIFNVFIGMFNLLPFFFLDGGHLAVAVYERWRERGGRARYIVDINRLKPVAVVSLMILGFLGFGLIYLDIANPIDLS